MDLSQACIPGEENKASVLPLPDSFLEFLKENDLNSSIYTGLDTIPRYIRLKPGYESQLKEIETELDCKLEKVDWLPGFFSIPPQIQIARTNAYRSGKIYGMDAASGAAVMALNVTCGDHVLDLCAAPGAKLCMLADLLGNSGTITGVDVAHHRLAACRTMLQKYEIGDRCRLFVADGTTFSFVPARSHTDVKISGAPDLKNEEDTFKEWTSKRTWKDRKDATKRKTATNDLTSLECSEPELIFYGRYSGVVGMSRNNLFHTVDAVESSTSGYDKLALLTNGFRLLKVGGSLVYSTCSLTVSQNEAVVEQFLSRNPKAELMKVDSAKMWRCRSGGILQTVRFDPKTSQTSGLFIAKFRKIAA
ncbi:uncharacterized protein LOC110024747 isoform X5 [Phalaenopsis equestris]|uniref:uncharacterized protein LOC110024747 isoform X5 n=1 Tax=Phalaenopsis equestris TaxID=78828 RepID=UPI0009E47254|nr:uncharacterized protein LOC110024747 isoform X5 [Phalaenopsis equestris]